MEHLIGFGLVLLEGISNGAQIQTHRASIDIGHKVGDLDTRLNLVGVGIPVDRIDLVGRVSPRLENVVEQGLDVDRRVIGNTLLLLGTDGCDGAAGDEQHDDYTFHNGFRFNYCWAVCSKLCFAISSSSSTHFR